MAASTTDEFLRDNRDAILAAVQARMRGDETMDRIALQRELSESDLAGQVLGFWLEGIRSDLTLGSTATMEQSLRWLVSLRGGHDLPFGDDMVMRMFDDICDEIDVRIDSETLRREYAAYQAKVRGLIAEAFPQQEVAGNGP
jgi:hypothetical protein